MAYEYLIHPTLVGPIIVGSPSGTGQSTAPTANTLALRDANANLYADNFIPSKASTVTAAGITTLTINDAQVQEFTGTSTQIVKLPTTGVTEGMSYIVVNNSTNTVTVQSSGGNTLLALPTTRTAIYTAVKDTPTGQFDWMPLGVWATTTSAYTTTVLRDTNANAFADCFISSVTSTATAAGTTTMTIADTAVQVFTGTLTQTVKLPSSAVAAGQVYIVSNQSTGAVTVQSSGANTIQVLATGEVGIYTAYAATPSASSHWVQGVTPNGTQTLTNKTLTSPILTTPDIGTPSAGTLTNATGLPAAGLVASTTQAVGFGTIELGHATDTTLSRSAAGKLAVEGVDVVLLSGAQTLTGKTLTSPTMTAPVLGTPASGTLTNCTGLPAAGLVASTTQAVGFGTIELGAAADTTLSRSAAGILAVEGVDQVNLSAVQTLTNKTLTSPTMTAPVLGTPASGTLTNATGLPASGLVASTTQAVGFGTIELGHATDTTISRSAAGKIAVEGIDVVLLSGAQTLTGKTLTSPILTTPDIGTPSAGTLTNATGLPIAGLVASTVTALGVGTVELGHATDTTLSRSAAGKLAVEGIDVVLLSGAQTLTGKTLTSPVINTPTGIVKGDVGLSNVDNTSNATERAAVATLSSKSIDLATNTLTGTTAQFNTALSDNDFATLAGTETFTNKTLSDTFMGESFGTSTVQRSTVLLASNDFTVLDVLEIPSTMVLEIPSTSSLEIACFQRQGRPYGYTSVPGTTFTLNTDNYVDGTYMFNNMGAGLALTVAGNPRLGQTIMLGFHDDGTARAITYSGNCVSSGVGTLLATTAIGKQHWQGLKWDGSRWACLAVDATGY